MGVNKHESLYMDLRWIIGITISAVGIAATVILLIVFSANGLRDIIASFLFRGGMVISWALASAIIILAVLVFSAKSYVRLFEKVIEF